MLKIYFQKILHHIFPRLHFQSLRCDWQEIFYQIKKQFFCLKIPKPFFFFIIPTCPLKKQKPRILCERRIWHQSALGFFFKPHQRMCSKEWPGGSESNSTFHTLDTYCNAHKQFSNKDGGLLSTTSRSVFAAVLACAASIDRRKCFLMAYSRLHPTAT